MTFVFRSIIQPIGGKDRLAIVVVPVFWFIGGVVAFVACKLRHPELKQLFAHSGQVMQRFRY